MIKKNKIIYFLIIFFIASVTINKAIAKNYTFAEYSAEAQEKYYLASKQFKNGEYESALKQFNDVISNYPDSEAAIKAQSMLGETYLKLNMPEKALLAYQKAVKSDSSNCVAWMNLGDLYAQFGKDEESEDAYKKAIELSGEKEEIYLKLIPLFEKIGDKLSEAHKYNDALKYYSQVLKLDKTRNYANYYEVKNKLAVTYEYLNDYENAEKIYRQLVDEVAYEGKRYEYILSLTRILINQRQDAKVLGIFKDNVSKIGGQFADWNKFQVRIGESYFKNSKLEEWRKFLQKGAEHSKEKYYIYVLIGGSYEAQWDYKNASSFYEKALQLVSREKHPEAFYKALLKITADSYTHTNEYEKTAEILSQLYLANREDAYWTLTQLVNCYLAEKEFAKAETSLDELLNTGSHQYSKNDFEEIFARIEIA